MRQTLIGTLSIVGVLICSAAGATELAVNGGFETEPGHPGWSFTGPGVGIDSAFPNNGLFDAFLSTPATAPNPGVISQSLATTPGQGYELTFALLDEAGFSGNTFTVSFGAFSAVIHGNQVAPPGNLQSFYTLESFAIPGTDITGASTLLSFSGLDTGQGDIAFNLDDVSVTASIPEPSTIPLLLTISLLTLAGRARRAPHPLHGRDAGIRCRAREEPGVHRRSDELN